jgi:hypothetical protein
MFWRRQGDNVSFILGGITSGNATGARGEDIAAVAIATSLSIGNASTVSQSLTTASHRADFR